MIAYSIYRLDSIRDKEKWVCNFRDLTDVDLYARAYLFNHANDSVPAGYPILKVYEVRQNPKSERMSRLARTYYPSAYDRFLVDMVESEGVSYVRD